MKIESIKYSDQGSKEENEDSLEIMQIEDKFVACIADGIEGKNDSKLASEFSVDFFLSSLDEGESDLLEIIKEAHKEIKELQNMNPDCKGISTTFTGCVILDNKLNIVYTGSSRLNILRGNGIKKLTEYSLECALGKDNPSIQLQEFDLLSGDRILLTTQGVHDNITKEEFRDLSKQADTLNDFGNGIVQLLGTKKAADNASFIAINVL